MGSCSRPERVRNNLGGARRSFPAALRNRAPILEFLKTALVTPGAVLEVGSGTGEHAAWFAPRLPHLTWQPTDPDPELRASIGAWAADVDAPNLLPPLPLDVTDRDWPCADGLDDLVAVVAISIVHIVPWSVTGALIRGAGRYLSAGGALYLYGPFSIDGAHTADSNARFHDQLRARNPDWGVRDLTDLTKAAEPCGFALETAANMPANNLSIVYRRRY